jgi:hypothetical protein
MVSRSRRTLSWKLGRILDELKEVAEPMSFEDLDDLLTVREACRRRRTSDPELKEASDFQLRSSVPPAENARQEERECSSGRNKGFAYRDALRPDGSPRYAIREESEELLSLGTPYRS